MIAQLLALFGAVLTLLAAIGVVRFPDVLARMHALTKATTIGLLFVVAGGAIELDDANDYTFVLVAGALQLITSPVGAILIARATYLRGPDGAARADKPRSATQRPRGPRSEQRSGG